MTQQAFEYLKNSVTRIYNIIQELELNTSSLLFDELTRTAYYLNKNRRAIYSIVPHKSHFKVFKESVKTRKKNPSSFHCVCLHFRVTFPEFKDFKPDFSHGKEE